MGSNWFDVLVAVVIGVLAVLGKRELNRIDEKAPKSDVTAALSRLDTHIKECREQNQQVSDTLLHVSNAVARIEGRLEGK